MIGDWGVEYGRFDADCCGASVEDGIDAVVEVFKNVGGGGGAGSAEAVGAGGGDGEAGGFDEGERDGVGGHADAYEGTACCDVVGDTCCAGEEKGERAGPEGGDEALGLLGDDGDLVELARSRCGTMTDPTRSLAAKMLLRVGIGTLAPRP
jgi:hypothetical protein